MKSSRTIVVAQARLAQLRLAQLPPAQLRPVDRFVAHGASHADRRAAAGAAASLACPQSRVQGQRAQ